MNEQSTPIVALTRGIARLSSIRKSPIRTIKASVNVAVIAMATPTTIFNPGTTAMINNAERKNAALPLVADGNAFGGITYARYRIPQEPLHRNNIEKHIRLFN